MNNRLKNILIAATVIIPGLGLLYSTLKNKDLRKENEKLNLKNERLEARNDCLEKQNQDLFKKLEERYPSK